MKGSGRGLFKILSRHFEKNHENCVSIVGAPAEFRTGHFPNMNEKCWLLSLLCCGLRLLYEIVCGTELCRCGGNVFSLRKVGRFMKRRNFGKPGTQMSLKRADIEGNSVFLFLQRLEYQNVPSLFSSSR